MLDFVLLIADGRLEKDDLLLRAGVIDALRNFQSLIEVTIFVVTLGEIKFILCYFWVKLGELFVDSGRVQEILAHVVAIGKQ